MTPRPQVKTPSRLPVVPVAADSRTPFPGHSYTPEGESLFRVFAPLARRVEVVLVERGERIALSADPLGYWTGTTLRCPHGTHYLFDCDGHLLPDPASRYQPRGVHGPSMVVEHPARPATDWRGVKINDAIIYELHIGAFTREGTLAAASTRLPELGDLGITVVELMPLAAFPGARNWGYDGVYAYALHAGYGDYAQLRAFIDAAHMQGIAVILDVVFNHFGPEGNYTAAFAPYLTAAATPWGAAINFDGPYNHGIRDFFLGSVRYWLDEIGLDGFRMDAVSLIFDTMPIHILKEITELARLIAREQGREILMIAEHLRNNRFVTSKSGMGFQAQWNDDLNHAIFARITGERDRHYSNFGSFADVVKALADGFVLDGTRLDRNAHYLLGTDGRLTSATEHVVHIQNHDQVGNRRRGDRLITSYGEARALLAITAIMASPFVPMLFMGEEYGETAPFLFFEDFSDTTIIEGVRNGRRKEFSFDGEDPPDPHAPSSFEASRLCWETRNSGRGARLLAFYRALIALKRSGALGPRDRRRLHLEANAEIEVIQIRTAQTLTQLNFSASEQIAKVPPGWALLLESQPGAACSAIPPYGARVFQRRKRV